MDQQSPSPDSADASATQSNALDALRRKMRAHRQRDARPARRQDADEPGGPSAGIVYQREVPRTQVHTSAYRPPPGPPVHLTDAVEGVESPAPLGPPYYRVERALPSLHARLGGHCTGGVLDQCLQTSAGSALSRQAPAGLRDADGRTLSLRDVILLDLETTGLSSSPLFLVGTATTEGDTVVVRQYLARTYAEERSVISAFAESAGDKRALVSFNGKSFDVPYLRARAAATRVETPIPGVHLDLLHAARRTYRGTLPDCRLQTLEKHVCLRRRVDDIDGARIGEAYHHFVRTGNAADMVRILKHNAWDLVTLLELLLRMLAGHDPTAPDIVTESG